MGNACRRCLQLPNLDEQPLEKQNSDPPTPKKESLPSYFPTPKESPLPSPIPSPRSSSLIVDPKEETFKIFHQLYIANHENQGQIEQYTIEINKQKLQQQFKDLLENNLELRERLFETKQTQQRMLEIEEYAMRRNSGSFNIEELSNNHELNIKLFVQCPPQCKCDIKTQRYWYFKQCYHTCYLNQQGYLFCKERNTKKCSQKPLLSITFKCDKDYSFNRYPLFDFLYMILLQQDFENCTWEEEQLFKDTLIKSLLIQNNQSQDNTSIIYPQNN